MAWMHLLEVGLSPAITLLKIIVEFLAVLSVGIGLVTALRLAAVQFRRRSLSTSLSTIKLQFGRWLALALEFQLGADILATTIAPSFEALGKLGAIAAIRTFLNFFLHKELEAEEGMNERRQVLETTNKK